MKRLCLIVFVVLMVIPSYSIASDWSNPELKMRICAELADMVDEAYMCGYTGCDCSIPDEQIAIYLSHYDIPQLIKANIRHFASRMCIEGAKARLANQDPQNELVSTMFFGGCLSIEESQGGVE